MTRDRWLVMACWRLSCFGILAHDAMSKGRGKSRGEAGLLTEFRIEFVACLVSSSLALLRWRERHVCGSWVSTVSYNTGVPLVYRGSRGKALRTSRGINDPGEAPCLSFFPARPFTLARCWGSLVALGAPGSGCPTQWAAWCVLMALIGR